ncbi:hypothetical protein [Phenylobacterium aquaticum]|uniref:hypothetical protein n=1 Tax=Phenylobacterium aquaticum TaxID=1763816 RepID=UPI0026ED16DB|nr:hypothetical protein [Phenylobacterium aquaticum]
MNPEFQRNLWLEAAPRRAAWAILTLGLIYLAVGMLAHGDTDRMISALGTAGGAVFFLCALVWGSRAAGQSVLTEIAERTWDFQRLSALSPWAMTWGKLAGATSLAWICGLTGLVFVGLRALTQDGDPWAMLFLPAAALFFQTLSLSLALIGVRKARAEGRAARAGGVLGGLALAIVLLLGVASSSGFQRGAGLGGLGALIGARGEVLWWGQAYAAGPFRALATLAFAAWALICAWRLMRLELQMRNTPLIWPLFLVFVATFMGGFAFLQGGWALSLVTGALAVALCAYAAAFSEPADRVRLRQFAAAAIRLDLVRAGPLTPATLAPTLLAAVLVAASFAAGGDNLFGRAPQAAALIAFLLRDLGIIALFRFGPRPQRGDFGAIVALAVLYAVGGSLGAAFAQGLGAALFAPLPNAPWTSFASGLGQALIAWALAIRRIGAPEKTG